MVYLHFTKNYQEFNDLIKTLEESKKPTFIVFTGTSNESGESWCSDCVKGIVSSDASTINNFIITLPLLWITLFFVSLADPIIKNQIESNEELFKDTNLVYAQVGKREE